MSVIDKAIRIGSGRINFKMFFDEKRVTSVMDKNEIALLAKFGDFTRKTARNSMRRKDGPSAPGAPPNAHTGFIKESLAFQYEPQNHGVVIGQTKGHRVAALHEFGGTVWKTFSSWVMGRETTIKKPIDYPARPFMAPAFEAAKRTLPTLFDQVYNKGQFNG